MTSDQLRQKLRTKLGIPSPKVYQTIKSTANIQVQPTKKGCCGKKV